MENITQVKHLFYALIIFHFLFLVSTNIVLNSSKSCFTIILNIQFILYQLLVTLIFLLLDTAGLIPCKLPSDCPENMCIHPQTRWCVDRYCECV